MSVKRLHRAGTAPPFCPVVIEFFDSTLTFVKFNTSVVQIIAQQKMRESKNISFFDIFKFIYFERKNLLESYRSDKFTCKSSQVNLSELVG